MKFKPGDVVRIEGYSRIAIIICQRKDYSDDHYKFKFIDGHGGGILSSRVFHKLTKLEKAMQ